VKTGNNADAGHHKSSIIQGYFEYQKQGFSLNQPGTTVLLTS